MKTAGRAVLFAIAAAAAIIVSMVPSSWAVPLNEMVLRDGQGVPIVPGSNTPYSPKQTCGIVGCHIDMVRSFGMTSGNIYESDVASATKDQGPGTSPYEDPYPRHGVSAGYHFQTGRNVPWGDTQRNYYRDLAFTGSPGMFGGSCPSYSRRLASLTETDPAKFDMSSYDFSRAACAGCHAGGGPLEYDREGYRYDGVTGLFQAGLNGNPEWGDYYTYDISAGSLVNKTDAAISGGSAEVDCFICHLYTSTLRYSLAERNFALTEAGAPGLAASLGLVGAPSTTGYLSITRKAGDGVNPDISTAGWSWQNVRVDHAVITSPAKENCALCHYADKGFVSPGPAGAPLGFTSSQKIVPAGTVADGDLTAGGANTADWKRSVPRSGSAFRGGSINDPRNPDLHMDTAQMTCSTCHYLLGTSRDYFTDCQYCHYQYWGYPEPPVVTPVTPTQYPALTDGSGVTIQPGLGILRIDHQFAKGDSDLKNMDQLDNTATCASCHIDRTHPNAGSAPGIGVHNGIPRLHFDKISCKVCHIPILNGPLDRNLNDFTAGPYQGSDRSQTTENALSGINKRPLYLWKATNYGTGPLQIQPFNIVTSAAWGDALSQNGVEPDSVEPALDRIGGQAAERLRELYGDADSDGVYDWTLNRPQGGDTALIVNRSAEIADFIGQMTGMTGAPANPVLNLAFRKYSVSHNLRPFGSTENPVLGSDEGGECAMCHSSSDPASPYYDPRSVGFFDRAYELFKQPMDGGNGLVQTVLPASSPLSGDLERVAATFSYFRPDGSEAAVNLSSSAGQAATNWLDQGQVLGYDAARLASLMMPQSSTYPITASAGPNGSIMPSGTVSVNAGTDQTFSIVPAGGHHIDVVQVDGVDVGPVSSYTFTFVVAPHTIQATFAANPSLTITASAGPNGSISPAGVTSVLEGGKVTYTITPNADYRVESVVVDGVSVGTMTTYTFFNVTENHTISVTFTPDIFIINSVAYGSGSIAPAGDTEVLRGGSQAYTITPNPGYVVSFVQVDGVNKGAITTYTFTNVTAVHRIRAYFKLP